VRLLLFDIDGTLLSCGGQPKPLFAEALREVFGTCGDVDRYDFSGRTDPCIVLDLMTAAGLDRATIESGLPRVRDAYLGRLEKRLDAARVRVLPGVVRLLEALSSRDDCVVALLTGNWERGAGIKLGRVGLDRYFAFGSFGDAGFDRRALPPVAFARAAERLGRQFAPEEAWIVGDSPLDVDCAKAHGIPCFAVATGWTSAETLAREGAHSVVADLGETETIVDRLLARPA
jgi:phosphoglycolate phosphatase